MIKIIAFDLVGVLVNEKDIELTEVEDKLERMFGPNVNDSEFLINSRKYIDKDSVLMRTTEELIFKLYKVREKDLFKNIKNKYNNVKIIIATNHVSFIRNFIGEAFGIKYLDDVIISAEIHKIKPNLDFYEHILNKYNIEPRELLFLDDNKDNINSAKSIGVNTLKVDKGTILSEEVFKFLKETN
ncbi:MAG: HAD-IA family hydrolase [Tenericutes bacterium]|jgi:putative hydrolase of the HAD superfamily|nr:HAD-IA family hydrolase [Mycoplasmatota bacterium]